MWYPDKENKALWNMATAVLTAVLLSVGTSSEVRAQYGETFVRQLELAEDGLFELTNVSGDISITGISGRFVRIRGTKHVQNTDAATAPLILERLVIEIESGDDRVIVRARHPSANETRLSGIPERAAVSVAFSIEVPRDVRVNLRTTSGNIRIRGLDRDIRLESVSGMITTVDTGGYIAAGSVRGDIQINGSKQGADANTVSGDIVLTEVDERIRATCVSGDITITGGVLEEVWANNTGGNIRCRGEVKNGARYQLTSHSGDIEFNAGDGSGFQVNLSTVSGSISTPLELTLTGRRTSRRSLMGIYRQSIATVELTTFSGNITLFIIPVGENNE